MNDYLFEDEMMGPERMQRRNEAAALLGGGDADYDRSSRRGSFMNDVDVDDEPMRRGSIAQDESNFLANRPDPGGESMGGGLPMIEEEASDPMFEDLRLGSKPPKNARRGSTGRPGAASLEPMAFGRERAGTVVGRMGSPYTPDIYRNQDEEDHFDALGEREQLKSPDLDFRPVQAQFLRDRMNKSPDVLKFGDGRRAPERSPLTQDEMFAEGDKLDYQHDAKRRDQRYLSQGRHWKYWGQAQPDKPDRGAFMSRPDDGWDRVKSRGFLGLPWFFSMLGSKLLGTKGGRYDQRKADLARRKGTFERARETYGSTAEGRQGVMPDWIDQSDWARGKWRSAEMKVNPTAGMRDEREHLLRALI